MVFHVGGGEGDGVLPVVVGGGVEGVEDGSAGGDDGTGAVWIEEFFEFVGLGALSAEAWDEEPLLGHEAAELSGFM